MTSFTAACLQMRSGLDIAANVAAVQDGVREAKRRGAAFVATPEMTPLLDIKPRRLFEQVDGAAEFEALRSLQSIAEGAQIWLLIGSMAVRVAERQAANRAFLLSPDGEIAAQYDKIHMFDVELAGGESYRESSVYAAGSEAVVAETPLAAFGLSICYDLRFPKLYRDLASRGAGVLCVPAAFTVQTGEAHWEALLRARAIETGAYVVAPAQGGAHEDGRRTFGRSAIIGPWGDVLAMAEDDSLGVVSAVLDMDAVADARSRIPAWRLEQDWR